MSTDNQELVRLMDADTKARADLGDRGKRAYEAMRKTQLALAQMGVRGDNLLETMARGVAGTIHASGYILGTSADFDASACAREVLDGPFGEFAANAKVAADAAARTGGKTKAELIAEGLRITDPATRAAFARKHNLM